jgi:hypothetical protein
MSAAASAFATGTAPHQRQPKLAFETNDERATRADLAEAEAVVQVGRVGEEVARGPKWWTWHVEAPVVPETKPTYTHSEQSELQACRSLRETLALAE